MDAVSFAKILIGDEVDIQAGCFGERDGGSLESPGEG